MKKMLKGAALTGFGVALLLGGGGTLAVWNASATAEAGQIVAGDLNLTAGTGHWSSDLSGGIADISTYRVVPGETLTYAQSLTVTLVGDQLEARLATTGVPNFDNAWITVDTSIEGEDGEILPTDILTSNPQPQDVTAFTTFEFSDETPGREAIRQSFDFRGVGYTLEQIAPGTN